MGIHRKELCAAAPLPSRGGVGGGVCNSFAAKYILTPPLPLPYKGGERLRHVFPLSRTFSSGLSHVPIFLTLQTPPPPLEGTTLYTHFSRAANTCPRKTIPQRASAENQSLRFVFSCFLWFYSVFQSPLQRFYGLELRTAVPGAAEG